MVGEGERGGGDGDGLAATAEIVVAIAETSRKARSTNMISKRRRGIGSQLGWGSRSRGGRELGQWWVMRVLEEASYQSYESQSSVRVIHIGVSSDIT
jgi:hypothetical protein